MALLPNKNKNFSLFSHKGLCILRIQLVELSKTNDMRLPHCNSSIVSLSTVDLCLERYFQFKRGVRLHVFFFHYLTCPEPLTHSIENHSSIEMPYNYLSLQAPYLSLKLLFINKFVRPFKANLILRIKIIREQFVKSTAIYYGPFLFLWLNESKFRNFSFFHV